MKKSGKAIGLLLSVCTALTIVFSACFNAFALGSDAITANENKATPIIFAVIVLLLAAAGVIYYIIQRKNKK